MTFEQFWDDYDYKVGRVKAERAWKKLNTKEKEQIFQHVLSYVQSTHKDGTYPSRKHPATYLNNKSWEDEITIVKNNRIGGLSPGVEQKVRAFLGEGISGPSSSPLGGTVITKEVSRTVCHEDADLEADIYREIELLYNRPGTGKTR